MAKEKRDSTIIYRSFYESIKDLPKENQAEVWNAIFEYSLNFKLVELTGISKSIFTLIKPQLDANIKRYTNGTQAKVKQDGSKPKAKRKQRISKVGANKNGNKNDKEKENLNVFDLFRGEYRGIKRGLDEEFETFQKHEDWEIELPKLLPALKLQNEYKDKLKANKDFVPQYKHLQTWLNQRDWTVEIPKVEHQIINKPKDDELCDGENAAFWKATYRGVKANDIPEKIRKFIKVGEYEVTN